MSTHTGLDQAWDTYYSRLEELRRDIINDPRYIEFPETRAKAYQSLLEAQAMAYRLAVTSRAEYPIVQTHNWLADAYTLGGTSPDFYYGALFLDGSKTYRLTGRFGDQRMIVLQGYSHLIGHQHSRMLGNFDLSQLELQADGSFDIIFSATEHKGNWIPLEAESKLNFFFIRRAIDDWNKDPGEMQILCCDDITPYNETDPELMAERVNLATDVMTFIVRQWNLGIYNYFSSRNDGETNRLRVEGGDTIASDKMGSPSTYYMWGTYEVLPDEALIIQYRQPEARYWSFQLFDTWNKPLDFVNRHTDLNMDRAHVSKDGMLTMVVAHRDPGIANWLDCAGRTRGELLGRNYIASSEPEMPTVRRVTFNQLEGLLPPDMPRVSHEQRQHALHYRRYSYHRMHDRTLPPPEKQ